MVGLGRMGAGMARRLAEAGLAPRCFDLSPDARTAMGPGAVETLAAAMRDCDVVVLSLPHGAAVAAAVAAFVAGAAPGAVLVDTSTLDVGQTRALAAEVAASGRGFLDAPVSGGPAGAASGGLTMMVGGAEADLARVRFVLEVLASRIIHVGAVGAGQVAKVANNLLVAAHLVAAGEAMRLVAAAGVPVGAVLGVVNAASGRSAATEVNMPRWILSGSFDSGFTAGLMRKDVGLALDLAHSEGLDLPVLERAGAVWRRDAAAVADGADFNRVAAWAMEGGA
ncbi:MAG: NAD(P)-dependent oxidoreductase [Rhodospirillales bacterium]|nr:NAD(P)-dependent oxidoreductase [Rhodospirillales bacterium]MDE2574933.1 NAD(P)-dependent oxidoreductase [Rhodospirillales bacterium]